MINLTIENGFQTEKGLISRTSLFSVNVCSTLKSFRSILTSSNTAQGLIEYTYCERKPHQKFYNWLFQ